jgi:hypothetical protein
MGLIRLYVILQMDAIYIYLLCGELYTDIYWQI